jgi:hypothetical protein
MISIEKTLLALEQLDLTLHPLLEFANDRDQHRNIFLRNKVAVETIIKICEEHDRNPVLKEARKVLSRLEAYCETHGLSKKELGKNN